MVSETTYPELVGDNIVDGFLSKAAEVDNIIDCLEKILYI